MRFNEMCVRTRIKIVTISHSVSLRDLEFMICTLVRKNSVIFLVVGNPRDVILKKAVLMDDKIWMRAYLCIFILIRGVFEWGSSWLRGRQGWFWVCAGVRKRGGRPVHADQPSLHMRTHSAAACTREYPRCCMRSHPHNSTGMHTMIDLNICKWGALFVCSAVEFHNSFGNFELEFLLWSTHYENFLFLFKFPSFCAYGYRVAWVDMSVQKCNAWCEIKHFGQLCKGNWFCILPRKI
jgi:hypothetical protein